MLVQKARKAQLGRFMVCRSSPGERSRSLQFSNIIDQRTLYGRTCKDDKYANMN